MEKQRLSELLRVSQSCDLIPGSLSSESVPLINIIKCQFLFRISSFYSSFSNFAFFHLWNFGVKIIYLLIFMVIQKIKKILGHDFYFDWDIQCGTRQNIKMLVCPVGEMSSVSNF